MPMSPFMFNDCDMRILVAEDNPINQQILEVILRLRHWECTIVNNGREAVEEAKKTRYNIIFMDINMPVLDGIEATKEIRATDKNTPIIAVTANSDDYYRQKSFDAGMNGFITKPVNRKDIYDAVLHLDNNIAC